MTVNKTRRRLATALSVTVLMAWAHSVRAAEIDRFAHTATLTIGGDVVIAGGSADAAGNPCDAGANATASIQILQTSRGGALIDAPVCMFARRSSHTATNLPDGRILFVGGIDNAGAVITTAETFDPLTGARAGTFNMVTGRYNHTATLLNNGKVLVCGGQNAAGTAIQQCELFDYASDAFVAGPNMLLARYNHTATLLNDGRVWFAGGVNPNRGAGVNPAIETTERYVPPEINPAFPNGFFQSASPLIEGRGFHTATLMGDGKVLVAGGYNRFIFGANDRFNVLANQGVLDTVEIFDPIANSVTTAAKMQSRRQQAATLVDASGVVSVFGGLGNITTTYFQPGGTFTDNPPGPSGTLYATNTGLLTSNIAGAPTSTAYLPVDITLDKPVVGYISDGEIYFGNPVEPPTITLNRGVATLVPGDILTGTGLRASLNGMPVTCNGSVCGKIQSDALLLQGIAGTIEWTAYTGTVDATLIGNDNTVASGRGVSWAGGILSSAAGQSQRTLNAFTLYADFTIPVDEELAGATVDDLELELLSGTYSQTGFANMNFSNGGSASPTVPVAVSAIPGGFGVVLDNVAVSINAGGTIEWAGDPEAETFTSPLDLPQAGGPPAIQLGFEVSLTATQVDLTGKTFTVDRSTVIIRQMVFGDADYYSPKTNEWSFVYPQGTRPGWTEGNQRTGAAGTLLPNGDTLYSGGRQCPLAGCTTANFIRKTALTGGLLGYEKNWAQRATIIQPRAFHTTTMLPNGKLLVAGGTNGAVLQTAEVVDPVADNVSPVSNLMSVTRDLHTATLLPTGRVLLAGGFSTTATSTGSTNKTDLYYYETNVFLPGEPMISSRSNHTATVLPDGKVLVAGGFGNDDVLSDTAEVYDPMTGKWSYTANNMSCKRAIHTAVLRKDGMVMLTGGTGETGILGSSVLYNPLTNTWSGDCAGSAVASLPGGARLRSHTATLLADGRILVIGGNDGFGESNTAYVYDPNDGATGSWTQIGAGPLYEPRFNHTANLLPNGDVMISGGSQRFGNVATTLEVYHPDANVFVGGVVDGLKFAGSPRAYHTMTLANTNKMIAIGGSDGQVGSSGVTLLAPMEGGYFTWTPDQFSKGFPPSLRQPAITSASNTLASPTVILEPSQSLKIQGLSFRAGSEGGGGLSASGNSDFNVQRVILQQVQGSGGAASQSDAGFMVDLTTEVYKTGGNNKRNVELTLSLPTTQRQLPMGWYTLREGANNIYSEGRLIQVGPQKPAVVTGITGTQDPAFPTSQINWTWNAPAGLPAAVGYSIYSATTGVLLSTSATNSWSQRGLDPSATASILVAGFTMSGDGALTNGPTTFTRANPPILGALAISGVTSNSMRIDWGYNNNSNPGTIYELSMSTDLPLATPGPGAFSQSVSTPMPFSMGVTTNNFTVTGLDPSTMYSFRVRAMNPGGQTSDVVNFFVNEGATGGFSAVRGAPTIAEVTGLIGTPLSTATIRWSWNSAFGATGYDIFNATTGVLLQNDWPTTSWVDGADPTDVPPGSELDLGTNTKRVIAVRAVTATGDGPLSAGVTAYTYAQVPLALSPQVVNVTTGSFQVRWSPGGNPVGTRYRMTWHHLSETDAYLSTTVVTGTAQIVLIDQLAPGTRYKAYVESLNELNISSSALQLGTTYTLPLTPTNLQQVDTTSDTISLSWAGGNGPGTVYSVQYSQDGFGADIQTALPFAAQHTATTYTITGLNQNLVYAVRVVAKTPAPFDQQSAFSVPIYTTNYLAIQPTNLQIVDSENSWAYLTWNANGNRPNTTRYQLIYSTSNFTTAWSTAIAFGALHTVTSFTVTTGLSTAGYSYAWRVAAVNPFGSPSVNSLTYYATNYIAAPPATIAITDATDSSISLSWNLSGNRPNTTKYRVAYSTTQFQGLVVSTPLAFSADHRATTFTITGLSSAAYYSIAIAALNPFGSTSPFVSPFRTQDTVTPEPTNLRVLSVAPFSIDVAWDRNGNDPNYARYQVIYSTDNFTTAWSTAVHFSQGVTGTTATISGLITGQTYQIRVAAHKPFYTPSGVTSSISAQTYNGGAPPGSIAGLAEYLQNSSIFGSLGSGRNVNLRVPARSFPADTTVTISTRDIVGALCPGGINVAFDIVNNPNFQPIGPIYFSIELTPAEIAMLPSGRGMLMRFDPGSGTCVPTESTLVGNLMTARINHFSLFQVGAAPLFTTANDARIFPNPYYAGRDGFVTFDKMPPNARIRVFTLRGEEVLDQHANGAGLLTWSGTNPFGRSISSGLYIVRVESGGSTKIMKLAVIR